MEYGILLGALLKYIHIPNIRCIMSCVKLTFWGEPSFLELNQLYD